MKALGQNKGPASALLVASMFLLLAACGQTGALYLPEDSGPVVIRKTNTAPPAETGDSQPSQSQQQPKR